MQIQGLVLVFIWQQNSFLHKLYGGEFPGFCLALVPQNPIFSVQTFSLEINKNTSLKEEKEDICNKFLPWFGFVAGYLISMSNITSADSRSFKTENKGEDAIKQQSELFGQFHSPNSLTSTTTTSNGSNTQNSQQPPAPPIKKKRNLPGNPGHLSTTIFFIWLLFVLKLISFVFTSFSFLLF